MDADQYDQIRRQVIQWVRPAGIHARMRQFTAVASRKEDRTPVTDADYAVQAMLLDAIAEAFPADAVIAEERLERAERHAPLESAARCWVIDPIDGTRNYAHGFPLFTVSVALIEAGEPVVGVVYEPATDAMYSASLGGGAWCGDRRLRVTDGPLEPDRFLALPSGREEPLPATVHGWIDRMVCRATGSTALNLALVASGAVDAAFSFKCRLWDMAGGAVLVREAGGEMVSPGGRPWFPLDLARRAGDQTPFFAAGPTMLGQLLAEFNGPTSLQAAGE